MSFHKKGLIETVWLALVLGWNHQAPQKETRMFDPRQLLLLFTCLFAFWASDEEVKGRGPSVPLWRHQGCLGIWSIEGVASLCRDQGHARLWPLAALFWQHVSLSVSDEFHGVLLSPSAGQLDRMHWKQDEEKKQQIIPLYFTSLWCILQLCGRLKMMHVERYLQNLHVMAVLQVHSLCTHWCTSANRWHHSLTGYELQRCKCDGLCSSPKWPIILSSPQLSKTTPSRGETVNELRLLTVLKVRQYCCRLSAVT